METPTKRDVDIAIMCSPEKWVTSSAAGSESDIWTRMSFDNEIMQMPKIMKRMPNISNTVSFYPYAKKKKKDVQIMDVVNKVETIPGLIFALVE